MIVKTGQVIISEDGIVASGFTFDCSKGNEGIQSCSHLVVLWLLTKLIEKY